MRKQKGRTGNWKEERKRKEMEGKEEGRKGKQKRENKRKEVGEK